MTLLADLVQDAPVALGAFVVELRSIGGVPAIEAVCDLSLRPLGWWELVQRQVDDFLALGPDPVSVRIVAHVLHAAGAPAAIRERIERPTAPHHTDRRAA